MVRGRTLLSAWPMHRESSARGFAHWEIDSRASAIHVTIRTSTKADGQRREFPSSRALAGAALNGVSMATFSRLRPFCRMMLSLLATSPNRAGRCRLNYAMIIVFVKKSCPKWSVVNFGIRVDILAFCPTPDPPAGSVDFHSPRSKLWLPPGAAFRSSSSRCRRR